VLEFVGLATPANNNRPNDLRLAPNHKVDFLMLQLHGLKVRGKTFERGDGKFGRPAERSPWESGLIALGGRKTH